jgi:hypothetical protein
MFRLVSVALLVALLCAMVAAAADEKRPKPTAHVKQDIEGWTVQVDDRLLQGPDAALGARVLKLVASRLADIKLALAAEKIATLQKVTIWLDRTHGGLVPAQYHPDAGWLKENGYDAALVKCVHIPDAAEFAGIGHQRVQPWSLLHELAHAYHDQQLGFDYAPVVEAWQHVKDSGRFEKVLHVNGSTTRHYALTDQKEFFAEMSESYLGVNDFYPFNRAELKGAEPEVYKLFEEIWGPPPVRIESDKPAP